MANGNMLIYIYEYCIYLVYRKKKVSSHEAAFWAILKSITAMQTLFIHIYKSHDIHKESHDIHGWCG